MKSCDGNKNFSSGFLLFFVLLFFLPATLNILRNKPVRKGVEYFDNEKIWNWNSVGITQNRCCLTGLNMIRKRRKAFDFNSFENIGNTAVWNHYMKDFLTVKAKNRKCLLPDRCFMIYFSEECFSGVFVALRYIFCFYLFTEAAF